MLVCMARPYWQPSLDFKNRHPSQPLYEVTDTFLGILEGLATLHHIQGLGFRISQNWGYLFGGPYGKDCNTLGGNQP